MDERGSQPRPSASQPTSGSARAGGMPWRTTGEKVRVVALSAAAISAIYSAGYLVVTSPAVVPASPSAVSRDLVPPLPPGQYRDGTYPGTARNVFGSVTVAVTIAGGQIGRVEITGSDTFYPQSYIDGLPAKVVNAQSADVPVVSGATASWQDFVQAVQQALRQAAGVATSKPPGQN